MKRYLYTDPRTKKEVTMEQASDGRSERVHVVHGFGAVRVVQVRRVLEIDRLIAYRTQSVLLFVEASHECRAVVRLTQLHEQVVAAPAAV